MSVLIKGMEMPKSCYECQFCAGTFEGCICVMGCGLLEFEPSKEIHPKCPLVEVPTPHGRLIDKDKLKNAIIHHLDIKSEKYLLPAEKSVFGNIIKANTVIEAEDEE